MSAKAARHARELLLKEYRGVLSTHSKSMPGFPFGSVVPYCLDAEGNLDWHAPAGTWEIIRFGHTTMGKQIQPAQWAAMGHECDKMNPEAVEFHMKHVIGKIREQKAQSTTTTPSSLRIACCSSGGKRAMIVA